MQPPIQERLGWREPTYTPAEGRDRAVMVRSLMYLFAAGGGVTLVSLAVSAAQDETRIAITGGCAFAISALLLIGYERIPIWAIQVFLACGTALVEWAVFASGDTTSPYAMFYFWIAIYAFYFLSRVRASMQMVFIGLAYSTVLVSSGDIATTPVIHWAFVTSTLVVAGAFIGAQRSHVDRLIA